MELIIKCLLGLPYCNTFLSCLFLKGNTALELVILISSPGTVPTLTSFPIRAGDQVRFFSVFRVVSGSFFGPPLCIWPTIHFSFCLTESMWMATSYTHTQLAVDLGWVMDEPEGGLETLAVEMLGLATGLLASPGSRVFFYFFYYSK